MLCIPVSLKASGIAEMIQGNTSRSQNGSVFFRRVQAYSCRKVRNRPSFPVRFHPENSFYLTNARNDKLPFHFRLRQQLFVKVVHSFIRMSDACDLQKLFKNRIQLLLIHQGNFFSRQLCAKLRRVSVPRFVAFRYPENQTDRIPPSRRTCCA